MPSKNSLKTQIQDGLYHVYNRGVEKRDIFVDEHDYKYFLWLLKTYLLPLPVPDEDGPLQGPSSRRERGALCNYSDEIELMAYCLMPNHFHLLIRQKNVNSMTNFMRSFATSYSMYFNHKYDRVGSLFQGRYKAVLVNNDEYLMHLSRYIHRNPFSATGRTPAREWSSYGDYIGERKTEWLKVDFPLDLFNQNIGTLSKNHVSYKDFVENDDVDDSVVLNGLTIDEDG